MRWTPCRPARAETPGSRSHSSCSRLSPSPSRVRAMPRTRAPLPLASADTSQPSEGRIRSAQIATVSAAHSSACRPSRCRPQSRSHCAGSCRHPAPALSAPLASHRSCQLWPGCAASQSSSKASPRTRRCWRLTSSSTNGGRVSRSPAAARGCKVAGQAAGTRRAGKRARIDSRAVAAAGSTAPACPVTAVTMRRCRTAHRASRAGTRAPGPAGPARLPAGSAWHDGPAAAGSRLPAAESCRSASW